MRLSRSFLVVTVLAHATLACGPSAVPDAGRLDAGPTPVDAGVDDAGVPRADGGTVVDAGVPLRSNCPALSAQGCRPIDPADVETPSAVLGIEMPGATFELENGDVAVVYPRYSSNQLLMSQGRVGSASALALESPEPAPVAVGADASGATSGTERIVVFYGRGQVSDPLGLFRLPLDGTGVLGVAEPIALAGVDGVVPYWPQLAALGDGRLLLGFVESSDDAFRRGFIGTSSDLGQSFTMHAVSNLEVAKKGNLVHVGATASGAFVVSWQEANADWLFTSWVQVSSDDGVTFSTPVRVAAESDNVHDTFITTRADTGADLYYLRDGGALAFNVFRRPLLDDSTLGPEQRVTDVALGHVEKPQARRLADGRLLLGFARRLSPSDYRATFALLDGDAPLE